jgi:two-component system sensor kinase FixL
MLSFLLSGNRKTVLLRAAIMASAIALTDWFIKGNIPLGFLYLFPMLLVGTVLNRRHIAFAALGCTLLTELFDGYEWFSLAAIPRDILVFAAFIGMGLFAFEAGRSRLLAQSHVELLEREGRVRAEAAEQLRVLVESSPAAVFTATSEGVILLANEAAHRLFGVAPDTLPGRSVHQFLPSLLNVPRPDEHHRPVRTAMQCRGSRQTGEAFLADLWFSTYQTSAGPRLAAMVVDTSEDLRNREEGGLNQLLAGSRILVAAVSHEIRNVCGAIAMVHANLARTGVMQGNKDFDALGHLILALEKIAAMELQSTTDQVAVVDLSGILEELRIVVESALSEHDVTLRWNPQGVLPAVWADRQSLMQVFLNLTRNSERAMRASLRRELTVTTEVNSRSVVIRFRDTGSGVAHPELLFRPFQQQATASGLGLYLSRAFMRSFRGELRFDPEPDGASFIVELARSAPDTTPQTPTEKGAYAADSDSARGRPQSVPRQPEPVIGV